MSLSNKANNLRQQQALSRKHAILKAAFDQFTQNGFAMTKMDDIAAQAQVSKGSIYNHFASKEALLEALVQEHIVAIIPKKLPTYSTKTNIPDFIQTLLLRIMEEACHGDAGKLLLLVITEGERFPNIAEMYYNTVMAISFEKLQILFDRAARNGLLARPELREFPQLAFAPVLQAMIWIKLFAKFKHMDFEKMLKLQLALIFVNPEKEAKTNAK